MNNAVEPCNRVLGNTNLGQVPTYLGTGNWELRAPSVKDFRDLDY